MVRANLDDAAKKGYEAAKEGVAEINKDASAAADNVPFFLPAYLCSFLFNYYFNILIE